MNWRKVKAEYVAGGISMRELAKKYGISAGHLMNRAAKEKWTDRRKAAEVKALEKTEQKTAEIIADNAVLLERAKTGLLTRVVGMIENYPGGNAQEIKTKEKGALKKYSIKDIAAVLAVIEDKTEKGKPTEIEDLAPLAELLKDE